MSNLNDRPLRVFVVENHSDTLKYYRLYLQTAGHEVHSAKTMMEALEKIPGSNCDVLISDVGLPDGSGWELLRRLKDEGLTHPGFAIAVSGFGTPADREKSRAAGFRHHLLKPFNPEELDVMLDEAVRELGANSAPT